MKKHFSIFAVTAILFATIGCSKEYDDTEVWNSIDALKERISAMETVQNAYKNNLFIKSVETINDGYTITFSDGSKATIANGKDGKDGETLIASITIRENEVTFTLTDGQSFSIPLLSALSVSFSNGDLVAMPPNSTRDIHYTVQSILTDIKVEVISSVDIKAEAIPDAASPKTGIIRVNTSGTIDKYSKVVVLVSNGEKVIMQSLTFEEGGLELVDNAIKTVDAGGGEVTLEYISNAECNVVIPAAARSWISIVPKTKALSHYVVKLKVAANTGSERSAIVQVVSKDGSMSLSYTINQAYYISSDFSEDGKVITLQTAKQGNGIDIVLMGDGYSDRQIKAGTYENKMRTAMDKFFNEEPYKTYKDLFNVYVVKAVSEEESFNNGNTCFRGYFGEGTLVGGDDKRVFEYALKAISAERMDEALLVVMMNSTAYAGTCYMYYPTKEGDYGNGISVSYFPVGTDATALGQVLHHEAGGHGFAKLADEYTYANYGRIPALEKANNKLVEPYGWYKNIDYTNDRTKVKWAHFLSDARYANDGLGIFEGASYYPLGVYRPTLNSIMRINTGGFNAPSREAIYYRIHKLAYGTGWTYNYEDFVAYDVVNRKAAPAVATYSAETLEDFQPLHAPVVVNSSWREVKMR